MSIRRLPALGDDIFASLFSSTRRGQEKKKIVNHRTAHSPLVSKQSSTMRWKKIGFILVTANQLTKIFIKDLVTASIWVYCVDVSRWLCVYYTNRIVSMNLFYLLNNHNSTPQSLNNTIRQNPERLFHWHNVCMISSLYSEQKLFFFSCLPPLQCSSIDVKCTIKLWEVCVDIHKKLNENKKKVSFRSKR